MNSYTRKMTLKEIIPFIELKDSKKLESCKNKNEIIKKALAGDFIVSLVFSAKDASTIIWGDDMTAVLKAFVAGDITYEKSKKQPAVSYQDLSKNQKKQILNYEINVVAYEPTIMDDLKMVYHRMLKKSHLVADVQKDKNTKTSSTNDVKCIISLDILKCLPKYRFVECDAEDSF